MKCPDCNGTGSTGTNCCGASMIGETDLCSHCKEHAEMEECETCRGSGQVEHPSDADRLYAKEEHKRDIAIGK